MVGKNSLIRKISPLVNLEALANKQKTTTKNKMCMHVHVSAYN